MIKDEVNVELSKDRDINKVLPTIHASTKHNVVKKDYTVNVPGDVVVKQPIIINHQHDKIIHYKNRPVV